MIGYRKNRACLLKHFFTMCGSITTTNLTEKYLITVKKLISRKKKKDCKAVLQQQKTISRKISGL